MFAHSLTLDDLGTSYFLSEYIPIRLLLVRFLVHHLTGQCEYLGPFSSHLECLGQNPLQGFARHLSHRP